VDSRHTVYGRDAAFHNNARGAAKIGGDASLSSRLRRNARRRSSLVLTDFKISSDSPHPRHWGFGADASNRHGIMTTGAPTLTRS
jgi:hypothetical protein